MPPPSLLPAVLADFPPRSASICSAAHCAARRRLTDLWLNDNKIPSFEGVAEALAVQRTTLTCIYLENNPLVSERRHAGAEAPGPPSHPRLAAAALALLPTIAGRSCLLPHAAAVRGLVGESTGLTAAAPRCMQAANKAGYRATLLDMFPHLEQLDSTEIRR